MIKRNQMMVLQALAEKEAALLLYNDPQEQAERKELIEAQDHIHHPRGRLVYHMELVGLLSQCCTGKNAQGEMLVRELLPLSDLVQQCLLPELTPALRANYMLLLDEAYLDTDKHQKEVATSEDVRQLLLVLRQRVRFEQVISKQAAMSEQIERLTERLRELAPSAPASARGSGGTPTGTPR